MDIPVGKLMDLFVDTVQKCGSYLLEMDDEDIDYYIFEEFNIGASSFLHNSTISKLKGAELITDEILAMSAELREKYFALENTNMWNVESVKCSKEWREVLNLSDEIKALLE
jgi:hypothetical protein